MSSQAPVVVCPRPPRVERRARALPDLTHPLDAETAPRRRGAIAATDSRLRSSATRSGCITDFLSASGWRDAEDLLAQRGITVTYETIRQWCLTFGPTYARTIRRCRGRLGDTWYLDEVVATIQGQRRYLWRAVDQDGDLLDILVQSRRDRRAAVRVFRKVLKGEAGCRAV